MTKEQLQKEIDFWDVTTTAPEQSWLEQTKHMVLPPPEPPPFNLRYMFQMEVAKPTEPILLSILKHNIQKDLAEDLRLYRQQWRLLFTLCKIATKQLGVIE